MKRCRPGCAALVWGLVVLSVAAPSTAAEPVRVTLEFRETDVLEVLKLLASKAGLNLVAGKGVTGPVTVFLKDVPVDDALEVVLAAGELAVERRGAILTVMPRRDYELAYGQPYADRRIVESLIVRHVKSADAARALTQVKSAVGRVVADEGTNTLILMDVPDVVAQMRRLAEAMDRPLETRLVSLNYGTVKAFAPLLQEVVTKGVGRVSVDERTNQVMVTDYPEVLDRVTGMGRAFDERATEVLIEAKIVQITLSDKFQLGIDWSVLGRETAVVKGLGALNLTSGLSLKFTSPTSQGSAYKTLFEALRTYGNTKILSEPRLTVVNNQEAKILVGTKEPYVTKSVSQTGTGTAVTSEAVNFIDVGVKLFVTPTITRDHFILMKIRPEVSSKTSTLTTSEKNEIPIVETAEAETVLLIADGETIIMGGLIKNQTEIAQERIPFLGDLPGVGALFRSHKKTTKNTELVIFLTPKIVTGQRSAPAAGPPAVATDGVSYYSRVMEMIHATARAQAVSAETSGTVVVAFTVAPDGRVTGEPQIISREAEALEPLARQAVWATSPFPLFPTTMGRQPREFKVPIRYSRRDES